jgi:hypothetical protein
MQSFSVMKQAARIVSDKLRTEGMPRLKDIADRKEAAVLVLTPFNPLTCEFLQIIYINSVRTSQETHCSSAKKSNQLMLFGETVAVYCENHTEYTYTLCGQNV